MKNYLFILLSILLFSCGNNHSHQAVQRISLFPSPDSGFILKNSGLDFLLVNALTDTAADSWWKSDADTIGRYYLDEQSGNYITCMLDLSHKYNFETHLLMEITPSGKLVRSERFFHGNYPCCWSNYYDGFRKYGKYYGMNTCGTGSGFCSDHLYLFRQIRAQDSMRSIPQSSFSAFCLGMTCTLSSTMDISDTILIMHYVYAKEGYDSTSSAQNETDSFDVLYHYRNAEWITTDTDRFKDISYF